MRSALAFLPDRIYISAKWSAILVIEYIGSICVIRRASCNTRRRHDRCVIRPSSLSSYRLGFGKWEMFDVSEHSGPWLDFLGLFASWKSTRKIYFSILGYPKCLDSSRERKKKRKEKGKRKIKRNVAYDRCGAKRRERLIANHINNITFIVIVKSEWKWILYARLPSE